MKQQVDDEQIILLSDDAIPIGVAPKLASHHAHTPLHLAFSVYIFNDKNELLVTQRAHHKKVWPGVWTNSCCGHPMPGESMEHAIARRVQYELGMQVTDVNRILSNYRYITPPYKGVVEHEVCPVYFAKAKTQPQPNPSEVDEYQWLSWDEFEKQTSRDQGHIWSWWSKDQSKLLKTYVRMRDERS